jgi:hypothetical protein
MDYYQASSAHAADFAIFGRRAKKSYERYMALARAAGSAGDAIEIENYYQHAEHYFRLMKEQAVQAPYSLLAAASV